MWWRARSQEPHGPGLMVRTRGTSGEPLWWFRSRECLIKESSQWQRLFEERDWMPGRTVVAALPNLHLAGGVMQAAIDHGLTMVSVAELDVPDAMAELQPTYLMTSPLTAFRLFLKGQLAGVRELWLTGDVTGHGALERRLSEYLPELSVKDVYLLAEHPGPLAVSCGAGHWHWLMGSARVGVLDEASQGAVSGAPGQVVLERDDGVYPTGDIVTVLEPDSCALDPSSHLITTPMWGRRTGIRRLSEGWIAPSHVAQAWYRTEGLSDRLRAELQFDPLRGTDVLTIQAAVLAGHDTSRTLMRMRELLERSVKAPVDIHIKEARSLWPSLTVDILDHRQAKGRSR